ncbi:hypothetical protein BGW42_002391 [Actinomortierella wolfii]|nr:hypothetical protein BGW42_002391 [Actinomortierella wolfii]
MASVKAFTTFLRPSLLSPVAMTAPRHGASPRTMLFEIPLMQSRGIRTRGRTVVRREIVGVQSAPFERPKLDNTLSHGQPSAQQPCDVPEKVKDNNNKSGSDECHDEQQKIRSDPRLRRKEMVKNEADTIDRSDQRVSPSATHPVNTSAESDHSVQKRHERKLNKSKGVMSPLPSSSAQDEGKGTSKRDEPRMERVSKTLEAFPFIPGATSQELATAHKFFFQPAMFIKSASNIEMVPQDTLIPEVAFIGRSNIGKSSLINGLVNRNGLVKTSSKPGHTRLMNFFRIGGRLSLVDMPGYGFKSRDEWGEMILDYFQKRSSLKRIYILVDPSHGLKESDKQIMGMLDKFGLSYQVILTKADKLSKTKLKEAKSAIEAELARDAICCFPQLLAISSKKKQGLDELRAAILKAAQLT